MSNVDKAAIEKALKQRAEAERIALLSKEEKIQLAVDRFVADLRGTELKEIADKAGQASAFGIALAKHIRDTKGKGELQDRFNKIQTVLLTLAVSGYQTIFGGTDAAAKASRSNTSYQTMKTALGSASDILFGKPASGASTADPRYSLAVVAYALETRFATYFANEDAKCEADLFAIDLGRLFKLLNEQTMKEAGLIVKARAGK